LRSEVSAAHARGESDADIIQALTAALSPEQLTGLYKSAVLGNKSDLAASIEATLFRTNTVGSGTFRLDDAEVTKALGSSRNVRRRLAAHDEQEAARADNIAKHRANRRS
jgi:hypothetical protein